jgi:hypothetical protein
MSDSVTSKIDQQLHPVPTAPALLADLQKPNSAIAKLVADLASIINSSLDFVLPLRP